MTSRGEPQNLGNREGNSDSMLDQAGRIFDKTQQERFPHSLDPRETFGLKIHVNEGVFSPKHFFGWKFFTPLLKVEGEEVLEIGCGHGIASVYMAKQAKSVVAVDLYPEAVKNTEENAEENGVENIDCRVSDVYSAIRPEEKFDTIYWNLPWGFLPEEDEQKLDEFYLARSGFDPWYRSIRKFILEGKNYLKEGGRILVGISSDSSNMELFQKIVKESGMSIELISNEAYLKEGKPEEYESLGISYYDFDDLRLYELRPLVLEARPPKN